MNKILIVTAITACGMWGGQANKWVRRYLIPSLASLYNATSKKKNKLKSFAYLILIGILSMGYGTNSKLNRLLGSNDKLTRIVYGLLVSIPFVILGKWYALIILPIAWSIKAGGFKITPTKDFLLEDLFRYGTLGVLVVL